MTNPILTAFSNTMVYMANRFMPYNISEENWKIIGQYPEIMERIINECEEPSKVTGYLRHFYMENPERQQDKALAKKFLFQLKNRGCVEVIFEVFSESLDYFFSDIEQVGEWLKPHPDFLELRAFNTIRSDPKLFQSMVSCDNLNLVWFKSPCPDNPERIRAWLDYNPCNFVYLPEKYRNDKSLFLETLKKSSNHAPAIFHYVPIPMQRLVEANVIMAQVGHYSMLHKEMQRHPQVFQGYCEYILTNRNIDNLDFIDTIPDSVWTEKSNIGNFLELLPKMKLTAKSYDHYGKWIGTLRKMKKHDPIIAQLYEQKESANYYYHLGSLSEVKKLYNSILVKKYLVEGITELAKDYRIHRGVMDLEATLPIKEGIKTKNKI